MSSGCGCRVVVSYTSGAAGKGRPSLGRAGLAPHMTLLLQPLKLKGIAFFRQKSNFLEATTALLSGVDRCFLGFETATLYLPCLL